RRSKATIQVLKSDAALNASFTGGDLDDANAKARAATQRMLDAVSANVAANRDGERREDASDDDDDDDDDDVLNPREKGSGKVRTDATAPRAMTKIMINGTREARELAKELIEELFARAAEARRQRRADDRERQRDKRARERRVYHLRHAADFERLGLPVGASQDEVKSAFRRLAVRWHPDKHAEGPARVAATEKFAVIQASYNNLLAMEKQIEQGMTLSIAHTAAESATARRPP
ncbi:DnaJ domain, partial [Ostreococcus tauri]